MDGEKPWTPSGRAEGGFGHGDRLGVGWVPPDLQMTDQFRVVDGDEAALLTAPDRPTQVAPVAQGPDAQVTEAYPTPSPVFAPKAASEEDIPVATAAAAASPVSAASSPAQPLAQPSTPGTSSPSIPSVSGPSASKPSRPLLGRRPAMLIAMIAGMMVIALGAGAAYFSRSGTSTKPTDVGSQQVPGGTSGSSQDQRGRASGNAVPNGQNGTAPAPQVPSGRIVSYATVQQEQGYFEGMLTLTNRTGAPMTTWELSFSSPGAYVKNIWGGVLVQAGPQAILRNEPNAAPIPVGGTVQVRFGAAGRPSIPQNCRLNGGPARPAERGERGLGSGDAYRTVLQGR